MSQQRFIRCPHCGLPHEAEIETCPVSGRKLEKSKKSRTSSPPPQTNEYEWSHSLHPYSQAEGGDYDVDQLGTFVGKLVEGKYRIEKLIGHGGMGAVFRAENTRIGKTVALKVLYRGYQPGSEAERRFLREARTAGSLGHPHIVEVFDLGQLDDGKPFQVMELLEGQSLAERIRHDGALPEAEALHVADQVLSALQAAHARGIIHRDLKPENVFLAERGGTTIAKLLDFGVSKSIVEQSLAITMTGVAVGTPFYFSPEQARGDRELDQRVDIWAMGVVLYEALTGVLPFHAKGYNELLSKILTTRPAPPSRLQPRITPAVEASIMRALSLAPAHRFPSAEAMRQALLEARADTTELDHKHPTFELEGPGDVTINQHSMEGPEDPTEVSDSFVTSDIEVIIKGRH